MVVIPVAKLQLVLLLLDIWDWLAAAFFSSVLLLVLRLALGRSPLVRFACRWLCSCRLCSCRWLLLLAVLLPDVALFCLLLAVLSIIIAPDIRILLAVLVPVLLYFILLATGSLAVVPSRILLTTGSLAVVPSVLLLQNHFVVSYDSVARFWLPSNITTQPCALRD